jgi:hypothetical protein
MKSAVPAEQYRLDPYFAVLLTHVESLGPMQLLHVLVVYKSGEADPVFFVTAELERPRPGGNVEPAGDIRPEGKVQPKRGIRPGGDVAPAVPVEPCLCIFAEDGTHSHLECSSAWADLDTFSSRAIEIVKERYGVSEAEGPED